MAHAIDACNAIAVVFLLFSFSFRGLFVLYKYPFFVVSGFFYLFLLFLFVFFFFFANLVKLYLFSCLYFY